jgi:hypothetical protein
LNDRQIRFLKWGVAAFWVIAGLAFVLTMKALGGADVPLSQLAPMAIVAAIVGPGLGVIVGLMLRRAPFAAGAILGQLLLSLPAMRLGQLAGGFVAQHASVLGSLPAWAAYIGGVAATAVTVLAIGSGAGIALEGRVRALFRMAAFRMPKGLPKPGWRAVRMAVILAILAAVAIYLDGEGLLRQREAESPAVSAWIEREKGLFRGVLKGHRYDTLVLPVQADGASFDRVARSLMTRYLARRLAERTGSQIPDPTLVARAFDARARQIELADGQRMAEMLGAATLIVSKVQRAGATFSFSSAVWTREGGAGPWRESSSATLKGLRSDDQLPPSVSFRDGIDLLLAQLKLGGGKPVASQTKLVADGAHPVADLLKLATLGRASPSDSALHLQLMAAMHERDSLEAQGLWERSLVALWNVPPSQQSRALEARAYLHLARRPYALQRLGEPVSAAERALLAEMNGNVPALEAEIAAIDNPVQRLMSEIALADLYEVFHKTERGKALRERLLAQPAADSVALDLRVPGVEWFSPQVHAEVWIALDRFSPARPDYIAQAAAWLRWLYWLPDTLSGHGLRLARSVEQRYTPVWRERGRDWAALQAGDRLAEWDYYDLLFALNRGATVKTFRSMIEKQKLPQEAVDALEALADTYSGHPYLTFFHASALDGWGRKLPPEPRQAKLFSRSSALALAVYRWEQGESRVSAWAEQYIYERPYEKYSDEPIRWYRGEVAPAREYMDRLTYRKEEMVRAAADAKRRLMYTDRNVGPLHELVRWLKRAGDGEAAIAAIKESEHRFVGAADRPDLIAELERTGNVQEDLIAAYRVRLSLDPDAWGARWQLARALAETGRHRDAQQVFLEFPQFAVQNPAEPVMVSNVAHDGGIFLYRLGQRELAEPLLLRSARMGTGSSREMRSVELLLLMQNRMEDALQQARHQVGRYNDAAAAAREVVYVYLLERRKEAWSTLVSYLNKLDDEEIWAAAFILHRMEGAEGKDIETWLAQVATNDSRQSYLTKALRERHAFMLALLDREPSAASVEHIRAVARTNNRSPYYPQIAEGYLALRKGDFPGAAQKLRGPYRDLYNLSVNRRQQLADLLPYLTWAHLRAGQEAEARKLTDEYVNSVGVDSDYLVARGLMDGAAGNHESAIALLQRASHRLPAMGTRSFPPAYVLLESCEFLLLQSGNDGYRKLILELSRRMHLILPYPWAAAFEAKYSSDIDDHKVAVAAAAILDPKSLRIADVNEAERTALRGAAARHASVLGTSLRKR